MIPFPMPNPRILVSRVVVHAVANREIKRTLHFTRTDTFIAAGAVSSFKSTLRVVVVKLMLYVINLGKKAPVCRSHCPRVMTAAGFGHSRSSMHDG